MPDVTIRLVAIAVLIFAPMLLEAARAARNERAQRARGGIEPSGDVYAAMRVGYPAGFAAMLFEGALRGSAGGLATAAGLGVFAAAKAIKWWAIVTLGPSWTFRVIVVPGHPLAASGPYRLFRHPNYVGVVGELVGAAVLTRAWIAGTIAVLAFAVLLGKRIAVEEAAIRAARLPAR
jgi:methyltransferase